MYKKIFFIALLINFALTLFVNNSYATEGGQYQTFEGKTSSADTANPGWWAYQPVTGTRYVFRINGVDIGTGGKGSQNYYINHVKDSTDLMKHNPSANEEKKGVKNDRNWELVYVGTFLNNTIAFDAVQENWHFFDTPCSSIDDYTTTLNGVNQYRHIIVWKRSQTYSSDAVHTDGFGLNGSDIRKLVGALKIRANALNDQITLDQISQIENGLVNYEIRAEILMSQRTPNNSGSGTVIKKDVYADYRASTRMYYTYREAQAIQMKIKNYAPAAIYNHFGRDTARQLVEMNTPWTTEYDSLATEYKNALGDALRGYYEKGDKRNYFSGFDYLNINIENPYKPTIVNESCQLEDGTPIEVDGYPNTTTWVDDSSKTFTRPSIDGYVYLGMIESAGGTKSDASKITSDPISGTTKTTHTIVYIYKESVTTTIVNEYCQLENGTQINTDNYPPKQTTWEDDSSKTFTRPSIDGYVYLGMIESAGGTKSDASKITSEPISGTTKTTHTIKYVYRELLSSTVTVNYISKQTNKLLAGPATYTLVEGQSDSYSQTGIQAYGIPVENYKYVSTTVNGSDKGNKPNVYIECNGTNYNIIFYYEQNVTVKIIGVCNGKIIDGFGSTTTEKIPLSKTYTASSIQGYDYLGNFVKYNTHSWANESPTSTLSSVEVTVNEKADAKEAPTTKVLIVFYYAVKSTIVNEYCQLENGTQINTDNYPPKQTTWEDDSSKTFTRPSIDGYVYLGMIEFAGGTKSDASKITSDPISGTTKTTHTIKYVYRELLSSTVTVNYISKQTNKLLAGPATYTLVEGQSDSYSQTGIQAYGIPAENYKYVSTTVNGSDKGNKPNVDIECNGTNYNIIFYYEQNVTVQVIGVYNKKIIEGEGFTETQKIPLNKKYSLNIPGYKCEGHLVKYGTHAYYTEPAASTDVIAPVEVKENVDAKKAPTTKVLVVFYYSAEYSLTVRHENVSTEPATPLGEPYKKPLIPNETLSISSVSSSKNLNYNVILNPANSMITIPTYEKYSTQKYKVEVPYLGQNQEIVFQYISCDVTVNHYLVNVGTDGTIISTEPPIPGTYTISENGKISSTSITGTDNYLNWDVKVNGISKFPADQEKYGNDVYDISFDIAGAEYVIDFYYVKQQLEIRHEWLEGGLLTNDGRSEDVVYLPTTNLRPLSGYKFVHYTLNEGLSTTNIVTNGTNIPVSVDPIQSMGGEKQVLIFKYTAAPEFVDAETTVIPNNNNNQLIGQDSRIKYWVLDNNTHSLTIEAKANATGGTTITGYTAKVKMPFDVYVDNTYYPANTDINVTFTNGVGVKNNIFVPIWVDEKAYDNKIIATVTASSSYTAYDDAGNEVSKIASSTCSEKASVTVVGRVYDFSITNIEGDERWRKSLFTAAKVEHKADTLPLGQYNDFQPQQYATGILKGANIYFTLNTKGDANSKIKITPKFYHVDQTGNTTAEEIFLYSKGEKVDTSAGIVLSRSAYRETKEYTDELKKAKTLYDTINYNKDNMVSLGSAIGLTLGAETRTPYLGYLKEFSDTTKYGTWGTDYTNKLKAKGDDVLKEVSHWYGNYAIPNDAECRDAAGNKLNDGFIVVYFEIETEKADGTSYLAYDNPSPLEQDEKISEWYRERGDIGNYYYIPRVTKQVINNQNDRPKANDWFWLSNGTAATIIYEVDASTSDGYTTAGTH